MKFETDKDTEFFHEGIEIREIGAENYGVFATKRIAAGDLLLRTRGIAYQTDAAGSPAEEDEASYYIRRFLDMHSISKSDPYIAGHHRKQSRQFVERLNKNYPRGQLPAHAEFTPECTAALQTLLDTHRSAGDLGIEQAQLMLVKVQSNLFARGYFPLASFFNHACYPNTAWRQYQAQAQDTMHQNDIVKLSDPGCLDQVWEGRACEDIQAGEQIFINYIGPENSLLPKDYRQTDLKAYHFTCECIRCEPRAFLDRYAKMSESDQALQQGRATTAMYELALEALHCPCCARTLLNESSYFFKAKACIADLIKLAPTGAALPITAPEISDATSEYRCATCTGAIGGFDGDDLFSEAWAQMNQCIAATDRLFEPLHADPKNASPESTEQENPFVFPELVAIDKAIRTWEAALVKSPLQTDLLKLYPLNWIRLASQARLGQLHGRRALAMTQLNVQGRLANDTGYKRLLLRHLVAQKRALELTLAATVQLSPEHSPHVANLKIQLLEVLHVLASIRLKENPAQAHTPLIDLLTESLEIDKWILGHVT